MFGLNLLASAMTQICERRVLGEFHLLIEELKHIWLHLDVFWDVWDVSLDALQVPVLHLRDGVATDLRYVAMH